MSADVAALPRILLADDELAYAFGVSPRKIHDLLSEPWAPKPIVLGPRLHRHSLAEWQAAVASMPRLQEAREPESLASARRRRIEGMKAGGAA